MSLGIQNVNSVNIDSIDYGSIGSITEQIMTRQDAKTVDLNTLDLSKFQKPELGKDLYSGMINSDVARQIAVRNSGMDINLNQGFVANLQYLNSKATEMVYTTSKNVEGKLYVPVSQAEATNSREVFALPKSAELENTKDLDKDKKGSNPFLQSQLAGDNQQAKKDEPVSIFS